MVTRIEKPQRPVQYESAIDARDLDSSVLSGEVYIRVPTGTGGVFLILALVQRGHTHYSSLFLHIGRGAKFPSWWLVDDKAVAGSASQNSTISVEPHLPVSLPDLVPVSVMVDRRTSAAAVAAGMLGRANQIPCRRQLCKDGS